MRHIIFKHSTKPDHFIITQANDLFQAEGICRDGTGEWVTYQSLEADLGQKLVRTKPIYLTHKSSLPWATPDFQPEWCIAGWLITNRPGYTFGFIHPTKPLLIRLNPDLKVPKKVLAQVRQAIKITTGRSLRWVPSTYKSGV